MPFTGKPTYGAGTDLPEIMEDVSDIIGIVSPYETPLLDHLGDAKRPALSTVHEWVEDTLLPNTDTINQTTFSPNAEDATVITVNNGGRFQVGDLVRPGNATEVMQVTSIAGNNLTVVRRYGGTAASNLSNTLKVTILGNAALEGLDDSPSVSYTNRVRKQNYTQIFAAGVEVSGSMQAARVHGVHDEVDFQKQERMREMLRNLENCVINGTAPAANQQGSSSVRRSMNGIVKLISTNQFVRRERVPGGWRGGDRSQRDGAQRRTPAGLGAVVGADRHDRGRRVPEAAHQRVRQQRSQLHPRGQQVPRPGERLRERLRGVPRDCQSVGAGGHGDVPGQLAQVGVMPLQGRSFAFQPLGSVGDRVSGQVIGEYTLEFKNENTPTAWCAG